MVKSIMNGIESQSGMGTRTARLGPLAPGQRWSVARKREVVLRLLHGEAAELLSRELGLPIYKLEQWRRKADAALDGALKGPGHCPGPRPTRLTANRPPPCSASVNSAWRSNCCAPGLGHCPKAPRPFGPQEAAVMAEAISPTTGRRHGVVRVCRAWEVARSSFYAARRPEAEAATAAVVSARRGPKPAVSDRALLAAIRADLARSPWTGEGHRKVLCGRPWNANA
jgi:hypothetical protein